MFEFVAQWNGSRIGTGFSVFHLLGSEFTGSAAAVSTAIRTWFQGMQSTIPDDVTISFPSEVQEKDQATGALLDIVAITPAATVTGSFSSSYPANSGTVTKWSTGLVVNGRRLNGRTFLVPRAGCFTVNGNVDGTVITADATRNATLITALTTAGNPLGVWSRTGGTIREVTSGATLVRPSTLRSRND